MFCFAPDSGDKTAKECVPLQAGPGPSRRFKKGHWANPLNVVRLWNGTRWNRQEILGTSTLNGQSR